MSAINAITRVMVPDVEVRLDGRTVKPQRLHNRIELRANRHAHLRDALGATIQALSGAIWITQDGDVRDIVLDAGDSAVLDRDAEVVISALSDATFKVAAMPARPAQPAPAGPRTTPWSDASGDAVLA